MAFKTRRQERYSKLRKEGFLPFEARPLSNLTTKTMISVPYIKEMRKDRMAMAHNAQAKGMTQTAYDKEIQNLYNQNNWNTAGKTKIKHDPWKMLRSYEDAWVAKQPAFNSPWKKKYRNWRLFLTRAENTIKKQGKINS